MAGTESGQLIIRDFTPGVPIAYTVDAGDVAWAFTIPQPNCHVYGASHTHNLGLERCGLPSTYCARPATGDDLRRGYYGRSGYGDRRRSCRGLRSDHQRG